MIDSLVVRTLRRFGYEARRLDGVPDREVATPPNPTAAAPWTPAEGTMLAAIARFAPRFEMATILDVGASDGRWSEEARRYYPRAAYLLIEAQGAPHEAALRRHCERWLNSQYVIAAAGHRVGSVHFDTSDPFSGVARERPFEKCNELVPMTTVDAEVEARGLAAPFLLKLDTHGFEREIFEGARRTLERTNLIVVEAYNFELQRGSLRFHQLCEFLEQRGFRCLDIVDVMRRPGDGVLWQCDLFFAPASRPEFAEEGYA